MFTGDKLCTQWVFLADETIAGHADLDAQPGHPQLQLPEQQQPALQPHVLAVRLTGSREAVDFLDPSTSPPNADAGVLRQVNSHTSRHPQHLFVSMSNLILEHRDDANKVWAAGGFDTCSITLHTRARAQAVAPELVNWVGGAGNILCSLKQRIQHLVCG